MRRELREGEGSRGKGTLCVHDTCEPTSHNTLIFTRKERQANSSGLRRYNPLLLIHEDKCPQSDQPSHSLYACARWLSCKLVREKPSPWRVKRQQCSSELPRGATSTHLSVHPCNSMCFRVMSWQFVHLHQLGGAGLG